MYGLDTTIALNKRAADEAREAVSVPPVRERLHNYAEELLAAAITAKGVLEGQGLAPGGVDRCGLEEVLAKIQGREPRRGDLGPVRHEGLADVSGRVLGRRVPTATALVIEGGGDIRELPTEEVQRAIYGEGSILSPALPTAGMGPRDFRKSE